jgi:hypothetical protein
MRRWAIPTICHVYQPRALLSNISNPPNLGGVQILWITFKGDNIRGASAKPILQVWIIRARSLSVLSKALFQRLTRLTDVSKL